jgi:nucleoside-diphosphate-sugar epimerase
MILVTGATGFVGRRLIPALRDRFSTKPIRILARMMPPPGALPESIQVFLGDLKDTRIAGALVREAEVIIHLAANVQTDSRDIREMRRANTDATTNLFKAAIAGGSKLFIHMSSAGVYGPARSIVPFKEDDFCKPGTPYQISKFEAEKALGQIDPKQIILNILRPPIIYGSGSTHWLAANKVFARRWSVELKGGIIVHPTHVQDIAEGIIALVERPAAAGAVFNLGGDRPILTQDLFALIAETLGCRQRRIVLSPPIAGPLGGIAEALCSLIGRPKPLLAAMCQGHCLSAAVDDSRFRERYPAVPRLSLTEGLREHVEWARANGLLGGAQMNR